MDSANGSHKNVTLQCPVTAICSMPMPSMTFALYAFSGSSSKISRPSPESHSATARAVAEWLSGDGLLIFDDEPEKAYSAKVIDGIGIEQIAVTGHCSVTFLCEPFAESIGYNQKAVQSVSLPDTVTINVKGTQETDGLIYITARGTITNLTVTRLKVN